MNVLKCAALLLAVATAGCIPWSREEPFPGANVMSGAGPLAVHVQALPADGSDNVFWERTLMSWPDAPVFLYDGKEYVFRLWAISSGDAVLIYAELGGVTEMASGPLTQPVKTVKLNETFTLKSRTGVRFVISVDRI
jgi:hypothetical protein